jgi:hypothetical protein
LTTSLQARSSKITGSKISKLSFRVNQENAEFGAFQALESQAFDSAGGEIQPV